MAAAIPAGAVLMYLGADRVATASMMAAAAAAPLNGVRLGLFALVDLFLLIALLTVCVRPPDRRDRAARPPTLMVVGMALIIGGGLLSTALAVDRMASANSFIRFCLAAAVPLVVLFRWQPSAWRVRRLLGVWVASAAASGVVSLLSVGDISGRVSGLTTHPNHLALVSAMAAGVALAFATTARGVWRLGSAAAYVVLALAVVESGSRAGLLALLVTTAFLAGRASTSRMAVVSSGLLLLLAGGIAVGAVNLGEHNAIQRTQGDVTSELSDEGRRELLEGNLDRIAANPVVGDGFATALSAHNIYLQVWASAGLLGLGGLVAVAVATVRSGWATGAAARARPLALGLVAGYTSYLVAGLFQNTLWDRYLWLHVALLLWLGALSRSGAPAGPQAAPSHTGGPASVA